MKILIRLLRTLSAALVALTLLLLLALSYGWLTPMVNYLAEPYRIQVAHAELDWLPLTLKAEGIQAGQQNDALLLESLQVETGTDFLFGEPLQLYVRLGPGSVGYRRDGAQWQLAGLSIAQWRQLFAGETDQSRTAAAPETGQPAPPVVHLKSFELASFKLRSGPGLPELMLNRVLAGPLYSDQPERMTSLQVDLNTAGGQLILKGAMAPLAKRPSAQLKLQLKQLSPDHRWLSDIPPGIRATLSSELQLELAAGQDRYRLQTRGDIRLEPLQLDLNGRLLSLDQLILESLDLKTDVTSAGTVALNSQLILERLRMEKVQFQQPGADLTLSTLNLDQTDLKMTLSDVAQPEPQVTLSTGPLTLDQLVFRQPEARYRLAALNLAALRAQTPVVSPEEQVPAEHRLVLEALDLQYLQARHPALDYQLETLVLDHLQLRASDNSLNAEAGALALRHGQLSYPPMEGGLSERGQETTVNQSPAAAEPDEMAAVQETERADVADTGAPTVAVSLTAEGDNQTETLAPEAGNGSEPLMIQARAREVLVQAHRIAFRDQNLPEPPLTQIQLDTLQLNQPVYPGDQPFPWQADLLVNGQSQWDIRGELQTRPLVVTVDARQEGMNLPDLTPYSDYYADVVFHRGSMANRIRLEIRENRVKGDLGFIFRDLDMQLKDDLSNLNLPLKSAFALLRDSDDRIELELDVDKSGEALEVGTGAIVRELLLAATQKATVSYLKYALQPFGTLMTLKDIGSGLLKSGRIPLEPVTFEPLQQTLTDKQKAYADKVAGLLADKPGLRLHYCYRASVADREAVQKTAEDPETAAKVLRDLHQSRLIQWRTVFSAEGLAGRMSQCRGDSVVREASQPSQLQLELKP